MSLSSKISGLEADAEAEMNTWGDGVLFVICLILGIFFLVLAFLPGHRIVKTACLAWAILP